MTLRLDLDSYKGVDGSSLSSARCEQLVSVYEMLEDLEGTIINYQFIQEEAERRKLFGSTRAENAIRTFFPLLKKLEFVNYEGAFVANRCFTELGIKFVLATRALNKVTDDTPNRNEVVKRLENIKRTALKIGLINMYKNPEWREHNMWIALKLLKELKRMNWNEYLYTLHCIQNDKTIDEALDDIKKDKSTIDDITFINKKGDPLPNTCYSYMKSLLEEAGLINKISKTESSLTGDADKFFSLIKI